MAPLPGQMATRQPRLESAFNTSCSAVSAVMYLSGFLEWEAFPLASLPLGQCHPFIAAGPVPSAVTHRPRAWVPEARAVLSD